KASPPSRPAKKGNINCTQEGSSDIKKISYPP
ncbi:unnamed protein product, partial [marine sediment metagenome]